MADVSAIVVNFNSGEFLVPCLESLRAQELDGLALELLVVDNASTIDQTPFLARAAALGARVVRARVNTGYGGGCNLGLRETRGRFVLFANADVKARPGALVPLLRHLDEHADVAFVEPRTFLDDELFFRVPEIRPLTPRGVLAETAGRLSTSAARRLALRRTRDALPSWRASEPREQPTLTGAFLTSRRDVVERLRGFDEGFPLYFEDADLFRRARAAGLKLVLVPPAQAIHYAHRSSATVWDEAMAKYRIGRRRHLRLAHGAAAVALDAGCQWLARTVERRRARVTTTNASDGAVASIRSFERFVDLGASERGPALALRGGSGPFLLELALDPNFVLAAAHFGDGERCAIPDATWRSLAPANWFLRALDLATLESRGAWRVRRP